MPRLALFTFIIVGAARLALAQIQIQPTPPPTQTAEMESWYATNEAVIFAGKWYYPGGPSIHFLPNEMVLSGFYRGIPLYTRTTIEPYSVVFVPVAGGLMRPYERRRAGDLMGTSGSSVPTLPVEIPSAFGPATRLQAAGPPFVETQGAMPESLLSEPPEVLRNDRAVDTGAQGESAAPRVGTGGQETEARPGVRVGPPPANEIYVEFNKRRWYASVSPASFDPSSLQRIGEWYGFPVYTSPSVGGSTIFIPVERGSDTYAAYSRK